MKKFKKLVALLLAMMMIFSIAPVAALADELELRPIHAAEQTTEDADEQLSEKTEQILPEEETAALTAQATDADNTSDADFARIFHLDCGRKYFSVSEIEGIIDQLAANYFTHIQLAFGNNGFRFLLDDMSVTANGTTYSSEAVTSAITSGNSSYSSGKNADSSMLSESDMNSIIAYAAEKGIEVIPMLNTPGHMDALVSAMETLEIRSTTGSEMSITSEKELGFIKALQKKYIDYFAGKGSTRYNFAADEYSFSGLSDTEYTAFAQYVNDIATMVKAAGMIPMAYNDGINYSGKTTSVAFDTDIQICYWAQASNYASVQSLSNAGFKIINNNDAWYYVLGDYLYSIWSSGQWGYEDALRGINNTPVTQAKNAADNEVPVVGSVLCCWCDGPSIGYTDTGVSRGTASARTQTNQESVYKLIQAMAAANPDYFKAEDEPAQPELTVKAVDGDVIPTKQADGTYNVKVKAGSTLTLMLANSEATNFEWQSSDESIAAVADGKVTFTGTAGTVKIIATVQSAAAAASAVSNYASTESEQGTYEITFNVVNAEENTDGDLTDIPEYKEGKVLESTSSSAYKYILDTDGVDAGANYLIVAAGDGYALRNNNGSVNRQQVDIIGNEATITDNVDSSLWQFSNATSGTIKNGNDYLGHSDRWLDHRLNISSTDISWDIASNGDGTYKISYDYGDYLSYTYYLRYSNNSFSVSTTQNTVRLYKQVAAQNYTVDATNLEALIAYADKLDSGEFSNWEESGVEAALAAAKAVTYENSYAAEDAANTAQASINSAAQALYNALSKLKNKKYVNITVKTVDESGKEIGNGSYVFKAYENGNGGYDYDFGSQVPTIGGYKYLSGNTVGTVTEETTIILVYEESDFSIDGAIEIPITIVDYRADGLLFDYSMDDNSIAYQLVQISRTNNSVSEAQAAISGTTLTSLTPQDNASGRDTNWYLGAGNGSYIRTGMVEENLGANGMPVYTDATVQYVADKLASGYGHNISGVDNWNDILYNTFIKTGASRSVRNSTTTAFSDAFKNSKTYDNITNAYDLAWYLLNTLYIGDTNLTEITDNVTNEKYTLPIYGLADSTYNKLILVPDTDGTYYMKAYTDGAKLKYDEENGAIYNSSDNNSNISKFMYPLCGKGYDKYFGDTTDKQGGTTATEFYPVNPNGNYTLRGESQFVYYANQGQYFEFTGDDDVYLFINGKLALDLGGAHWSLSKTVNMDDIAEKCGLVNGEVATFTFFYMERYSDCSNFGIRTNLGLVQRGIKAEKNGYDTSYNTARASGSVIENGTYVAYDLVVTNQGDVPMNQIKFEDTDNFGGSVSFGYGVSDTALTANSYGNFVMSAMNRFALFITDRAGNEVENTRQEFTTIDNLSAAVAGITLNPNQSLHVRFLQAEATVKPSEIASYINTVKVTAVSSGQTLTDSAIHELYSYNANDTAKDYVVDFGLPLKIANMFDESSHDYFANPNEPLELNAEKSSIKYGELQIGGTGYNTVLTYTLKENVTIDAVETVVLNVKYKFGEFGETIINLQKTIRIIPATTVYYEDDLVTFKNSNGNTGAAAAEAGVGTWYTVGQKSSETVYQALDKLGDNAANNYGFDPAYEECSQFSLGSAVKVTVDSTISSESCPTATFTFKGTGFDIISLTDYQSGAIYVDVYKGNSTEERVKGFFVNNYYGYKQVDGKWVVDTEANNNALYQIPVMKVSGLDYGTYTVVINVRYYSFQDVQKNGSYSFWLDAIRVYDPAGTTAINNEYLKDDEGYPQYIKLRDKIADTSAEVKTTVFIDGGNVADIATYANYGPNNEVYLANGQAISFKLEGNLDKIASVQIGAKAPNGTAAMSFGDKTQNIATATEMYYDITDYAKDGNVVTITNTGSGILSLTNVKVTFTEKAETAFGNMNTTEQTMAVMAVRALFAPPAPVVFEPETFTVTMKNNGDLYVGEYVKVTVTTSDDVDYITVGDKKITRYTEERTWGGFRKGMVKTGKRIWNYYVSFNTEGQQIISVIAYDEDGLASAAIENTVNVKARSSRRSKVSEWHI